MKQKITLGLVFIMMLSTLLVPTVKADVITNNIPQIDAVSFIVVEGTSGEILFGNNYQSKADIADLSKIMTAILAIEKSDMDKVVTVGKIPENLPGGINSVFLREGEKVKMEDLLKASIIYSANDATYAIAEAVGGNEEKFVGLMNEKAKEIGMKNTTFVNSYGQSNDEGSQQSQSTAEDLAILGRYAMNLEKYRQLAGSKSFEWRGEAMPAVFDNKNAFITGMAEATGVKSGYDERAKYVLVGSAKKDGRELMGVILGSSSEAIMVQDMAAIINYGLNNTKMVPVVQKNAFEANLVFGENKQTTVVAGEDFSLIRPAESNAIIEMATTFNDIDLPIKKDQKVGVIEIKIDGQVLNQVPLIATEDVSGSISILFVITCVMTILYIMQMSLRAGRIIKKSARSAPSRNNAPQPRQSQLNKNTKSQQPKTINNPPRKNLNDRPNHNRDQSPRF